VRSAASSDLLRSGLGRVLDTWRDRFDGANDLLQGVLRLQLSDVMGHTPPATSPEARRAYDAIRGYYDNVRYAILSPTAMLWGTVSNALRVSAGVDTVTPAQKHAFSFAETSLVAFVRAAHHDTAVAESLCEAFRPMPSASCQSLAALLDPQLDARDAQMILAVVRVLGNEGPLSSAEAQAAQTLENAGLVGAAFAGIRGRA
jgi:hypothetical protein